MIFLEILFCQRHFHSGDGKQKTMEIYVHSAKSPYVDDPYVTILYNQHYQPTPETQMINNVQNQMGF